MSQGVQTVDQRQDALADGLHGKAEPVPAGKLRRARQLFEDIQRQIQPVGFLGIHREADPGIGGLPCQSEQTRHQLCLQACRLRQFVAWMQRRNLDRYAGAGNDGTSRRFGRNRGYGVTVRLAIPFGILERMCRLAQHVE